MGFFKQEQEDEMDKYIELKSLKIAYLFTVLFLLIWGIIDYAAGNRHSTAILLFFIQNSLFVFLKLYYKKKLCEVNEE